MSTVQARLPILGTHIPNVNVIDDHIDGLEHALAYARYMRNLSLPALRLPPELLALVFLDLFEYWPSARTGFPSGLDAGQEEPRSRFVYQLNWISAALHVCHMWRNQLLLCPSLWSYVDTAVIPPRLAPWFIDLSRTAPLRLGLELSRPHEQFSSFEILRSVLLPQQLPRLFALGLNLCDLSIHRNCAGPHPDREGSHLPACGMVGEICPERWRASTPPMRVDVASVWRGYHHASPEDFRVFDQERGNIYLA
ncbi:hypothetical protein PENSPDRAFT_247162 [Peniophora sp. CONT]|nr:hypothetical protein PENSPDRAFT_247162 [Peniophora sp. CONT]